jgi:hypothetical protein
MIDTIMVLYENWDNMDEVIKNPKELPLGKFEEIYNEASDYNILYE